MINKRIPAIRSIIAIIFLVWGLCWFLYFEKTLVAISISLFFIVIGVVFSILSIYEILRYKKTGEARIRLDERAELNTLKASRNCFRFLFASISIFFLLLNSQLLSGQHVLKILLGLILASTVILYFASYYFYERRG